MEQMDDMQHEADNFVGLVKNIKTIQREEKTKTRWKQIDKKLKMRNKKRVEVNSIEQKKYQA